MNATSEEGGRHQNSSSMSSKTDTTTPQPPAPKKSSQPSKLVDLGAAAVFASQAAAAESQKKETAPSTIDSVFGDFSSQPPAPQPPQPPVSGVCCDTGRQNLLVLWAGVFSILQGAVTLGLPTLKVCLAVGNLLNLQLLEEAVSLFCQ